LIDVFTLALTHGLIVLALWRLLFRPELDAEDPSARPPSTSSGPWRKDEKASPDA
jgi:hypothetical protein